MKRLMLFSFLLLLSSGCKRDDPGYFPIASEEYDVYRCVIRYLADSTKYQIIFVTDSTLRNNPCWTRLYRDTTLADGKKLRIRIYHESGGSTPLWEHQEKYVPELLVGFDTALATGRMKSLNALSYRLAIDSMNVFNRVRRREWSKITQSPYAQEFSEGRVLILWFSRVAINDSGNQALVYSEHNCGELCGAGLWIWLRKKGSDWCIETTLQTWVS